MGEGCGLDPRGRILSALSLEEPDRVPLLEIGISDKVLGRIFPLLSHTKAFRALSRLGLDSLVVWPFLNSQNNKQLDDSRYLDEFGRIFTKKVSFSLSDFYIGGSLNSREKYSGFPRPDPLDPWKAGYFREAVESAKDDLFLFPCCGSTFEVAIEAVGFVEFSKFLYSDPDFIRLVIKDHADYCIACGNALVDAGAEVVLVADDFAYKTGPFVSPRHWMEFVYPHLKRVIDNFHKRGVLVMLHSDGNISSLLDGIVRAGVDAVQPLEPTAGMRLGDVKKAYGDRLCLTGNIDVAYTLAQGSVEEVVEEVRKAIRDAAYGGGYILGSGHTIHDSVIPRNFVSQVKAGKKYGKYPVSTR